MAENIACAPDCAPDSVREAVCIHTSKIFDSCKDKDCIEDLRVYPTCASMAIIESACSIRPRGAKLLHADIKVEEINFNRGCYTVDVTYFYKVTGEAFPGQKTVTGLAIFEKRVILYGSEGSAKQFTSRQSGGIDCGCSASMPVAVVEAVDPLPLSMKIVDAACAVDMDCEVKCVPDFIARCFDDEIVTAGSCKRLYVTLGQFSIIRLERDTQLLIPVYDYCIPNKECAGGEDDPCTIFGSIPFPVDDFFPPNGDPAKCSGGCAPAAETV